MLFNDRTFYIFFVMATLIYVDILFMLSSFMKLHNGLNMSEYEAYVLQLVNGFSTTKCLSRTKKIMVIFKKLIKQV